MTSTRPHTRSALVISTDREAVAALESALERRSWEVSWSRRIGDAAYALRLGADVVIADVETAHEMAELALIARAVLMPPLIVRAGALAAPGGLAGIRGAALQPGRMRIAQVIGAVELLCAVHPCRPLALPMRMPSVPATKWLVRLEPATAAESA